MKASDLKLNAIGITKTGELIIIGNIDNPNDTMFIWGTNLCILDTIGGITTLEFLTVTPHEIRDDIERVNYLDLTIRTPLSTKIRRTVIQDVTTLYLPYGKDLGLRLGDYKHIEL